MNQKKPLHLGLLFRFWYFFSILQYGIEFTI